MLKNQKHKKICNCLIPTNKNILKEENNYSFCQRCGSIIFLNNNGNINYTIKPKIKQNSNEVNPVDIIKNMKNITEKNYPNINNEYNININEEKEKEKFCKTIAIYISYRKMIIILLQKLLKIFDFNDVIFYQCLFFMDYIYSHLITEKTSEKEIINYLIGYFLISSKIRETSMTEPPLESFLDMDIKEDIILSKRKIAYYEVLCLKSINYNIYSYSAYDWIVHLIGIGIVFNCEINIKNSIILINDHRHTIVKSINKYAFQLLLDLIIKNVFIKYSPMYIAFSIIQISREKFLAQHLINQNLFNKLINLYGIKFDDYKNCYEEIKLNIPCDKAIEDEKNIKEENQNNNESNNKNNMKLKIIKKKSVENSLISTLKKLNNGLPININKRHNESFAQEQNNYLDENNLKLKKIINKKDLNNDNSEEFEGKNKDIYGIINDEEKQVVKQNKIEFHKNFNFSINYRESSLKRNDNLPLIIRNLRYNKDQIKKNAEKKNFSKSFFNLDNNSTYKLENSKEKNLRKSLLNIYTNKVKFNKKNIPFYKINLIKKPLFKDRIINSNNKKLNEIKINNLLSISDFAENKKTSNNSSLSKKNILKLIRLNNDSKYQFEN